jgi:hypothetical protein
LIVAFLRLDTRPELLRLVQSKWHTYNPLEVSYPVFSAAKTRSTCGVDVSLHDTASAPRHPLAAATQSSDLLSTYDHHLEHIALLPNPAGLANEGARDSAAFDFERYCPSAYRQRALRVQSWVEEMRDSTFTQCVGSLSSMDDQLHSSHLAQRPWKRRRTAASRARGVRTRDALFSSVEGHDEGADRQSVSLQTVLSKCETDSTEAQDAKPATTPAPMPSRKVHTDPDQAARQMKAPKGVRRIRHAGDRNRA